MSEREGVKRLLTRVAEVPGAEFHDPAGTVLHRIRVRRRRRQAAAIAGGAIATVVAVLVPALAMLRSADTPPEPASTTPSSRTVASLANGRWSMLPEAPIEARRSAAATWTGRQLLVWGGITYDTTSRPGLHLPVLHADGAAYDPATRRWEKLPPAPLSPRMRPAAAWTGREWLLWGSDDGYQGPGEESTDGFADGAAYNPETRTWRRLPTAPLRKNIDARAVWTGRELVVLSRFHADQAAAYDPATGQWRSLPALPVEPGQQLDGTTLVTAGDRLYVWAHWFSDVGPDNVATRYGTKILAYDRSRNRWSPPAFRGGVPQGVGGWTWTGSELIVLATGGYAPMGVSGGAPQPLAGYRLQPATGVWGRTAEGPPDEASRFTLWAGDAALSMVGEWSLGEGKHGQLVAWDSRADRWVRLARAPYAFADDDAVVAWTGREVLVWGLLFPSDSGDDWERDRRSAGLRLGPG